MTSQHPTTHFDFQKFLQDAALALHGLQKKLDAWVKAHEPEIKQLVMAAKQYEENRKANITAKESVPPLLSLLMPSPHPYSAIKRPPLPPRCRCAQHGNDTTKSLPPRRPIGFRPA